MTLLCVQGEAMPIFLGDKGQLNIKEWTGTMQQ
jgi:hypothetical protein